MMNKIPLIVFDIDGTLTDFNKYISKKAIPYFKKKYHLEVKNPDALEISDIFDLKNTLMADDLTVDEAEMKEKSMLSKYWISHRFLYFSLCVRYRKHAVATIKYLKKNGFDVQIHSTRAKCTEKNLIGAFARALTRIQCWTNGLILSPAAFHFYANDEEKIAGIIQARPLLAFDDKPEIIGALNEKQIHTCSVSGTHNTSLGDSAYNVCITSYEKKDVLSKIASLLGKRLYAYYFREARSAHFFSRITWLSKVLQWVYHPVVLHEDRIADYDMGVVYAPNHIRTVDPLIIDGVVKRNIHWAALKRFFDGSDSIFNNSKNHLLCRLTQWIFEKLDFFPIVRKRDSDHPNNMAAIKDMSIFLKCGCRVGIFPEGTTRKNGDAFFGEFDQGFVSLAERNHAVIQPILLYWYGEKKKNPIVDFGKVIVPSKNASATYEKYMEEMSALLQECKSTEEKIQTYAYVSVQ